MLGFCRRTYLVCAAASLLLVSAAPVVALGAPLGALVVSRVGRRPTLIVVSILCVVQFFWTLMHERAALDAEATL